jgi:hypothetical protein
VTPPLWARLDEDLPDDRDGLEDDHDAAALAGTAVLARHRDDEDAARVGIVPAAAHAELTRLLSVLEAAYPIRFEARDEGQLAELDALVCVGEQARALAEEAAAEGLRTLVLLHPEDALPGVHESFETSASGDLQRALRGRAFPEGHLGGVPALAAPGEVLATRAGQALWIRAGELDLAAAAPRELGPDEALRERLEHGRCAALMPLVHLLRELSEGLGWTRPAPRATLLLDDPNLHWPSYGFAHLPALADHADVHGYHVALATIPLDAWFAHPATARLLRQRPRALSLLVHGNDHTGGELGRPTTESEGVALAAQALRRIAAFERRFKVPVARVMAPPHEACSEATVRGLARCGFHAISTTRPYPWLAPRDEPWLSKPPGASPLTGWGPADVTSGGLPVLLRHPFAPRKPHELALRAFLDQPLIVYGHHNDLADGLEAFEHAAAEVNGIGPTRWCSLAEMARTSLQTRREGSLLRVRPLSRRVSVELPEGIEHVTVELPPTHASPQSERVLTTIAGIHQPTVSAADAATRAIAAPGGTTLEIELRNARAVHPYAVAAPRPRPLAVARRLAGETRDRALPLLGRARLAR